MGYQAAHVLDAGLLDASDSRIWDHAIATGATLITKDEDFAIRSSVSKAPPSIVWIRIGNCPNTRLLAQRSGVKSCINAFPPPDADPAGVKCPLISSARGTP